MLNRSNKIRIILFCLTAAGILIALSMIFVRVFYKKDLAIYTIDIQPNYELEKSLGNNLQKNIVRSSVNIHGACRIQFLEDIITFDNRNPRVVVSIPGISDKTIFVGRELGNQWLTLTKLSTISDRSGNRLLIAEYEGGATGARSAFVFTEIGPRSCVPHFSSITTFGKVVVLSVSPLRFNLWNATDIDLSAEAGPRIYQISECATLNSKITCRKSVLTRKAVDPYEVSDLGIDVED